MEPLRPAFRPLEVHRVETPRPGVVLVDPLGLLPAPVFLAEELLPVLALFDGERTIAEVERALAEAGSAPPPGFVRDVAEQLDQGLLLRSELFRTTFERTLGDFLAGRRRPARHAGSNGYPAARGDCRVALEALLGEPPECDGRAVRGLVAPHIDLARGAAAYRAAYRRLAAAEPADLYVVLGTGHRGPAGPVTGLELDWETPRGTLRTDRRFVTAVHRALGAPAPLDVWLHRDEHSVEFQMLFLAHVLGARAQDVEVAGFLCGALPCRDGDPDGADSVAAVVAAFEHAAAQSGKRVCWVAGADLAHVGPFFGDPEPVDDERRDRLRREEEVRLGWLERGAPGTFHRSVHGPGNPDRICSATAIYLTARLAGGRARLLHYGQALAEDRSQCVSFCSAAFD